MASSSSRSSSVSIFGRKAYGTGLGLQNFGTASGFKMIFACLSLTFPTPSLKTLGYRSYFLVVVDRIGRLQFVQPDFLPVNLGAMQPCSSE